MDELVLAVREQLGVDISPRTVRYYIAEGVLRRPDARGKFSLPHLDRLKLILLLKKGFLPIPEIREKLQLLSDSDVTAELGRYETQSTPPSPNLAAEYTRRLLVERGQSSGHGNLPLPGLAPVPAPKVETWQHITLTPSIELHIRQPLSREDQAFLNALLDYAQKLRKL